jgi:hypothetical protein
MLWTFTSKCFVCFSESPNFKAKVLGEKIAPSEIISFHCAHSKHPTRLKPPLLAPAIKSRIFTIKVILAVSFRSLLS